MPGQGQTPRAAPKVGDTHDVLWTWISLVIPGLASAGSEAEHWVRQFNEPLAISVALLYLEFSGRVIPKPHFHMHITSLVSFVG